ncbi:uncharacterized protein LOC108453778 isoform X1 [Gossypium arboreum]|uniref:uncharacterized protein LOC108453778 isoform X1 n=1 Tax=Gossypium arboreum TaxID=29729 RepID=UPI0022F17DDE|nr:uncharacterized protein LOC108453778 isoform X1 [Gossypium arboreum]
MEDSGEQQTEENKGSVDVANKKRTFKTPAQLLALEEVYKEQKFPSDEMKARLAVQIRLTEKQISSWFCHRRLKDKRRDESYPNGRQDHSSGVIQDRGSGLRQDSCGSIKQGDYRNIDLREVESRRIYGQEFPAADLKFECRSHQNPYDDRMEDTSSESNLSLNDQPENGAITQINPRSSKSIGYKPSGYLKVKGEIENPAITAVKRQLGRHFKEDGPLLGIQFDSLPPGAFEFPSSSPVNEPMYVGDTRQTHSPDISGVIKQPSNIVNVHNSKISSQDSDMEGAKFNTVQGSERLDRKSHHQLKHRSSLDIYNDSTKKSTLTDSKRIKTSSKFAVEKMGSDSFPNHPSPYGMKISDEQQKPWLHDDDSHTYKAPKNENLSRTSNLIRGYNESSSTERGSSARMGKVEKLRGEWKTKKECPVTVKNDLKNKLRVSKQVNVQYPQQDFAAYAPHARLPLLTNQTKGGNSNYCGGAFLQFSRLFLVSTSSNYWNNICVCVPFE